MYFQKIRITIFQHIYGLGILLIIIPVVQGNTLKKLINILAFQLFWQINCWLDCKSVSHLLHISVKSLLQGLCIWYGIWCLICFLYRNLMMGQYAMQITCGVFVQSLALLFFFPELLNLNFKLSFFFLPSRAEILPLDYSLSAAEVLLLNRLCASIDL